MRRGGGLTPSPPRVGCAYVRGAATGAVGAGYFGDGSDGDVVITGDTPLDVQEDTGQIIKQYKSLTVNAGATLRPAHRCNGMILLVQEDCTIAGKISVSKCAPLLNEAEEQCQNESHIRLCGALVGGNGGKGGNGRRGGAQGGVGGNGFAFGGGYGGGGAGDPADRGVSAAGGPSEPRPPKGITWPCTTNSQYGAGGQGGLERSSYPYGGTADGGAAPGGSGGTYYVAQFVEGDPHGEVNGLAGDAYGGGALWIFVGGQLKIESTGEIEADGGIGASTANNSYGDTNGNPGLGGSGGGGIIALVHTGNYVNSGTVHANGGAAAPPPAYATGTFEWPSGSRGAAGSIGTVLITNIQDLFGGTT